MSFKILRFGIKLKEERIYLSKSNMPCYLTNINY